MKRTYEVEILGQRFNIKSEESQEHVNRIVNYVSEKMKTISKDAKTMSLHHAAILTLLNVADELFKSKQEVEVYKENVLERTKNIIHLIDAEPQSS